MKYDNFLRPMKIPYVLVAEKSVISVSKLAIQSIKKYAKPVDIYIIVPVDQTKIFKDEMEEDVRIVPERDVLPDWTLLRIASLLSEKSNRAGWYLQQFLKLSFGQYSKFSHYIVWDADTIMLKPPVFEKDGKYLMNTSKEYHKPYFDTFYRLFGLAPILKRSVVSQYMLFETSVCLQMQEEIISRGIGDWIEVVLRSLPRISDSEFSEYETYANYLAHNYPSSVKLEFNKWFRYGSEIFESLEGINLEQVESKFSGYSYVVFERHRSSVLRRFVSRMLLRLGF